MENKEIILNDIIKHLDLLINNEPIDMELSEYIEWLKDDILFLFKSLKKEKPKLTEDEKVVLRNIDKEYKWIARDEDGTLSFHSVKPHKEAYFWSSLEASYVSDLFPNLFRFIKWENEEPYSIEELLKGEENYEEK